MGLQETVVGVMAVASVLLTLSAPGLEAGKYKCFALAPRMIRLVPKVGN